MNDLEAELDKILDTQRNLVEQGFYSRIIADEKAKQALTKLIADREREALEAFYVYYRDTDNTGSVFSALRDFAELNGGKDE